MRRVSTEDVPERLYEALRARAAAHGRSIESEALAVLAGSFPIEQELASRRELLRAAKRISR